MAQNGIFQPGNRVEAYIRKYLHRHGSEAPVEAQADGFREMAVIWGWQRRERLVAARPDFLVDSPEGLLPVGSAPAT